MSNTKAKAPKAGKAKALPTPPGMPTDPVRRARWTAIRAAGGASHVGRTLGYTKGEPVRMWYVSRDPSPAEARKLVAMCQGAATLAEILPDAFKGLTAAELGYRPA